MAETEPVCGLARPELLVRGRDVMDECPACLADGHHVLIRHHPPSLTPPGKFI